ncbi:MAG: PRC-barrel domain-containing protein [Candidatus Rehaiarchaeum fermentans]|nr:PRC-barrel domain-containing protein [Candidatus Rehaiarchaeum fermentans]MCW1292346.1 PRC-barrel domain-containing protein [Candidatus Rehaiarchaeum fermentans]MCW1293102.1 PRC-barrel domain-containing protein [Candidatus Rehaiarchaeum fermentans]MCW1293610.1 PRC-barrel domain-containing protein [Candidatus Rehaiarchaeum fermentans]MCW1293708.1 PRC-barrel domain-containing protein [Candidatus Rehaiarchaeum fermentans]
MALKLRTVSSTIGINVYTENGMLVGQVTEAIIKENKISAWKVDVLGESVKRKLNAKGIIVNQALVRAIGDIMIISEIETVEEETKAN